MSDLARLDGKLAIVTGGGSGIGEATAKVFAEAGATVVVTGRRSGLLERVAKEISGYAMVCDVSDQAQVRTMFTQALQITGQIDILLNNAGGAGPIAPASGQARAGRPKAAGRS
ncbi:MAG: SDR family NAD(P)-dependent oxidoreductase [Paracoccaceae bacterium]|nr:SDR family NAD(P)-dependent oxidoreductase [Paracoccaceae bacterium]